MAYALTAAAATTIFVLVPILLLLHSLWKPSRLHPLPPGPTKLPIVDNMFDIPTGARIWLKYAEMCRKYKSDIIHLSALGNSIVALNSAKMNHRWGTSAVFRPNDDLWKAQRKILNQALPPADPQKFHQKELSATHDLLRVLPYTDNVMNSLQTWAAAFIMDITYGLKGEEAEPYLPTGMAAVKSMGIGGTPGAFYVDQIPIHFQRKAREWSDLRMNMTESIFNVTKEKVAMGIAAPSLTSFALEEMDDNQNPASQEDLIKITAITAFSVFNKGGADTPLSVLGMRREFTVLAMIKSPEVQAKAHSELERVLGPRNLPNLNDAGSLPYITVNCSTRDIAVQSCHSARISYLLPKGSSFLVSFLANCLMTIPNRTYSTLRGSSIPMGKLTPAIKDPAFPVFGFGRRVCPGKTHITLDLSVVDCYCFDPDLIRQSDYEDEISNSKSLSSESDSGLRSAALFLAIVQERSISRPW
ncbi:cytochrome P450 [Lentinula lateritia]|nr:cytochrome P450 [Lentinula lateritia]